MTPRETTDEATNGTVEDRARRLRDRFADAGYKPIEPSILQPADAFIGLSGESIRRRLYVVQGSGGEDYCLRPDVTIPVARLHLESGATDGRYCYAGPSFRRAIAGADEGASGEFQQAGFEIFGSRSPETDIAVFELAVQGLKAENLDTIQVRMGDPGLFRSLIAALDVPDFWRERLVRHFWRRDLATGIDAAFANNPDKASGNEAFATALAALDREAASGLVEEVLALAGIKPVGGRSADEIAHRFMERAALAADPLPESAVAIVRDYLAIEGAGDKAIAAITALNKTRKLGLDSEIDRLGGQLEAAGKILEAANGKSGEISFSTDFGRNLEYYTGLVFEIHDRRQPGLRQIAGGGRYDRLLTALGATAEIPAVGCAIYVNRLTRALEG
jgi:ATP phosphoribosyltransferase regulatory subunit